VGKRNNAKQRLEGSPRRSLSKQSLKLAEREFELKAKEVELARQKYKDSMLPLWRDAKEEQRVALEEMFRKHTGSSLQSAYEERIIASLERNSVVRAL
jgi:hypothetical protein